MKITETTIYKYGIEVVARTRHTDPDASKNDAIRELYIYDNHGLTWNELCDAIDNGTYTIMQELIN